MNKMVKFVFNDREMTVIKSGEDVWFRGHVVASILGYANSRDAIMKHVDDEDKVKYGELPSVANHDGSLFKTHYVFINESGLYSLVLRSQLGTAKKFKRWVTGTVLPSIRKTGTYSTGKQIEKQFTFQESFAFNIQSEFDLQVKVVKFLRGLQSKNPDLLFSCTLGGLLDTDEKRIKAWQMGYQKGIPDIVIYTRSAEANGLAIELKSPRGTGYLPEHQEKWLHALKAQGWMCLVSNSYDEVITTIQDYLLRSKYKLRLFCMDCDKTFKSEKTLTTHKNKHH